MLQAGHCNISSTMITYQLESNNRNNFKKKKMCCILGTINKKEACSGFDVSFSQVEVERERKRIFSN